MSILDIRFRVNDGFCIAQVLVQKERSIYDSYSDFAEWRDVKPEDILDIGRWLEQRRHPNHSVSDLLKQEGI